MRGGDLHLVVQSRVLRTTPWATAAYIGYLLGSEKTFYFWPACPIQPLKLELSTTWLRGFEVKSESDMLAARVGHSICTPSIPSRTASHVEHVPELVHRGALHTHV